MWIVTVGMYKGGAGKTTLATLIADKLASEKFAVVGIDCDPAGTFKAWSERREASVALPKFAQFGAVPVVQVHESTEMNYSAQVNDSANRMNAAIEELEADGVQVIIIDSPGWNSHLTNQAHIQADIVVTPVDVSDDKSLSVLRGDYGTDVMTWNKERPKYDLDSFTWFVAPNKVRKTADREIIYPYHAKKLVQIEGLAEEMGFTVTPALPDEPAHGPASDQGFSVINLCPIFGKQEVGKFDKDSAVAAVRACVGKVLQPAFRRVA